ncbi:PaaI family thioesterase [Sneathiella chinensis]|uniref:Thioesterase domain-containing protein n=1 Tax=Sneathiella chinensis TaxID=349750 RepID=A0ABQ5U1I3_9PROT|nr:PaaI family thioesterase [Sneathiella chinensis]GLQ05992.1 hypothetical protein GCM10007924_12130 [Sneathiella chinensis]
MSFNPFSDQVGLEFIPANPGESLCKLRLTEAHFNPHKVVHGGVLFTMADTGMGSALYPTLPDGQICATIEIKINYFRPVLEGEVTCHSRIVNRGRSIANIESEIQAGGKLVAKANGSFAIYTPPTA